MLVSVIICSHLLDRYWDLVDATFSVLKQSYNKVEAVIVVDGNKEFYEKLVRFFDNLNEIFDNKNRERIKFILNQKKIGLTKSRNRAIREARGNIIAFLDDDAIADKDWINNLLYTYERFNTIGVGGKILPLWISSRPDFLPEELFWIIGVTFKGFPENVTKVRNTFGSNISFKREAFEKVGLFNENFGIKGSQQLQAEEVEFCLRALMRLEENIVYDPKAIVYHKVYPEKIRFSFIFKRAFWQGYSKALLNSLYKSGSLSEESKYLKQLLFDFYLKSLKRFLHKPIRTLQQILIVTVVIILVVIGFLSYKTS